MANRTSQRRWRRSSSLRIDVGRNEGGQRFAPCVHREVPPILVPECGSRLRPACRFPSGTPRQPPTGRQSWRRRSALSGTPRGALRLWSLLRALRSRGQHALPKAFSGSAPLCADRLLAVEFVQERQHPEAARLAGERCAIDGDRHRCRAHSIKIFPRPVAYDKSQVAGASAGTPARWSSGSRVLVSMPKHMR